MNRFPIRRTRFQERQTRTGLLNVLTLASEGESQRNPRQERKKDSFPAPQQGQKTPVEWNLGTQRAQACLKAA